VAFSHSPLPRGNRVGLMSNSGGFSVIQTDLCAAEGLDPHRFSDQTLAKLRRLVPVAGASITNPLDSYAVFYRVSRERDNNIAEAVKAVASDENIDSLVIMFDQFRFLRRILQGRVADHMIEMTRLMLEGCEYCRRVLGKPVLLNVSLDPFLEDAEDRNSNLALKKAFEEANYPVFSSSVATVKALGALYKYATLRGLNKAG
jgi:acetate---CoA ligase (ADP-forming)